ncbi:unnamed protein product [Mytilus coruscus]|uniref:Uncharacterized protein n=1 Tax=Mytilus coruscus TaxID=42192 RepID=A0A6J8AB07_MYTCO|nr:unnamed protein product [Mytilus coruscus]
MDLNEEKLKKWEETYSSKLDKMDEAIKQTEIFVESVRDIHLQEQSRLNDSYYEIVKNLKIQSKNETEFHGEQMNTLLESLASKIEEFGVVEKNKENALESMRNTLHQEQNQLNRSFEIILENFRLSSNRTIEELTAKQQKDYEALVKKQSTVAFSAYTTNSQTITSNTNVKFNKVWTNIGMAMIQVPEYLQLHVKASITLLQ